MKRLSRGFTLIELLVVVAIIALLIAILLPSLAKAKQAAKKSACLANTKSIGTTLQIYITDYSSLIPYGAASVTTNNYWTQILDQYGANAAAGSAVVAGNAQQRLRQCPEAPGPNPNTGQGSASLPWNSIGNVTNIHDGAYGLNGWVYSTSGPNSSTLKHYAIDTNTPGDSAMTDMSAFWHLPFSKNTAEAPLVADSSWPDAWPTAGDQPPGNLTSGAGSANSHMIRRFVIARHGKSVNVAFLDGHAENKDLVKLWQIQWHTSWPAPNPLPTLPAN